ncbi:MAG: aminopeptidase P family protein [Chloroflexi bacterium]|nr:aminopeptidase P family protein [Chloroflexota bacterium]
MSTPRIDNLRRVLTQHNLDALLVRQAEETPNVNLRYLSGFTGSAGVLIAGQSAQFIASDSRYWEQIRKQSPAFSLLTYKNHPEQADAIGQALQSIGATRVGYEANRLTAGALDTWRASLPGIELVATTDLVEGLRAVKDAGEMGAIRRATALTDRAYEFILTKIEPGMSEKEVAWELESFMRTHGAEGLAFDVHVASGPGTAEPHHVPSERAIQVGEPIWIDMGARVDGYCADLTRSFVIGEPDAKFSAIYAIVQRAQNASMAALRSGVAGRDVDAAARKVIEDAGYGDNFGHGLGHGFGLQIHEKPSAGRVSQDVLPAGSLVTVEPGIYIPGWGGVRIEDVALITQDGAEVLTGASKWRG